jgi:hypothetical protein
MAETLVGGRARAAAHLEALADVDGGATGLQEVGAPSDSSYRPNEVDFSGGADLSFSGGAPRRDSTAGATTRSGQGEGVG